MNERIEQLAIEAFFDESTNTDGQKMYTFGEEKMQLFAELIVRECAGIYEAIDNGNEVAGTENYLTALHNIYLGDKK